MTTSNDSFRNQPHLMTHSSHNHINDPSVPEPHLMTLPRATSKDPFFPPATSTDPFCIRVLLSGVNWERRQVAGGLPCEGDTALLPSHYAGVQRCLFWCNNYTRFWKVCQIFFVEFSQSCFCFSLLLTAMPTRTDKQKQNNPPPPSPRRCHPYFITNKDVHCLFPLLM